MQDTMYSSYHDTQGANNHGGRQASNVLVTGHVGRLDYSQNVNPPISQGQQDPMDQGQKKQANVEVKNTGKFSSLILRGQLRN